MDILSPVSIAHKYTILGLAIFNLVIALLLLILPQLFAQLNKILNFWVPTEKFEEMLNKKMDLDDKIMKARKFIGVTSALVAVALFFLYTRGF